MKTLRLFRTQYEAVDAGQPVRFLIKNKDNGSFHMDPKSKGAVGRNGIFNPARARSFGSEEEAHDHALKHLYTSKKGYDLVRYHNGKILENESGVSEAKAVTLDARRQTQIGKDHESLMSKPTDEVHKIHQGTLGRIHSKYTPAEVGGKKAMVGDILRYRHGDKHVAHYFGLSEDLTDACWKGYEAIGMKMKNGKKVPNCVPKEDIEELDSNEVAESDTDEVSESTTDGVNLKITKHSEMARKAAEIGDTRTQMWHLARVKSLKALLNTEESVQVNETDDDEYLTKAVKEALENDDSDATDTQSSLSTDEEAAIERIKLLIRLGLLDNSEAPLILRVLKKLAMDQPVTAPIERQAINDLLHSLISVVTGDDSIFSKVRIAVQAS